MICAIRAAAATILVVMVITAHQAAAAASDSCDPKTEAAATTLVILLHGYTQDPTSLDHVRRAVLEMDSFRDSCVLAPLLPFGLLSTAAPAEVIAGLLQRIDAAWNERAMAGRPFKRVVLVGHSIGSLFARKVYAAASGEFPDAPFEPELKAELKRIGAQPIDSPRPWAGAVDRIVLLAGLNRGWSVSHHMSLTKGVYMSLGTFAGRLLQAVSGRQFMILRAHQGAPFITQLRLQWLAMRDGSSHGRTGDVGGARVVQLLGTVDDLVPPTDHVDPVTGRDFAYIEVPLSGHLNVIEMDETAAGRARANALKEALVRSDFSPIAVRPPMGSEEEEFAEDRTVKDVVFVVHGIRDEGYWTLRIANRVVLKGREQGRRIEPITSSYGYFPMLSFLRPGARQEKVEWLMDQYTVAKAKYPEAEFSFVGHSNGTYLLARALEDYPAVKFKNVAFAGSVVHRDFRWADYVPRRVQSVFNFVATADWVVAWFPKALQQLQVQDLGSAGHDGFAEAGRTSSVDQLQEYVIGGHGAALDEAWWDAIAEFVLSGHFVPPSHARTAPRQASWVKYPGMVAPLIWVIIALVLAAILRALLKLRVREWQRTLLVIGYLAIVWMVITEV